MSSAASRIVSSVTSGLKQRLAQAALPSDFFGSWNHCSGSHKSVLCHSVGLGMLSATVADLPQVEQVAIDVRLKLKDGRWTVATWQPDVVGFRCDGDNFTPVVYADLETPNSSDARIPRKDIGGYRNWINGGGHPAPYVLVISLPDWEQRPWPLTYTGKNGCNKEHAGKLPELRAMGPLAYWTTAWRKKLKADALNGITILNVGNGKVQRIRLFD